MGRVSFNILGLEIHWYGVIVAMGIVAGLLCASKREKIYGLKRDTTLDLSIYCIPAAIIGARAYFVAFSWDAYRANPIDAVKIWEGGLAIYGGIIGGVLAGLIYARIKHIPFLTLADLVAPGIALGQAIGRWGNFVNREAYGIVSPEWMRFFPLSVNINGVWHCATFFYESVWCLGVFIFLLMTEKRLRASGTYVVLYALERCAVEGLRTDSLLLGSVRISQLLSAAAVTVVLVKRKRFAALVPAVGMVICSILNLPMYTAICAGLTLIVEIIIFCKTRRAA